MRCDLNMTIDQKQTNLRSSAAKEAAHLIQAQLISEQEYQVACLYEYSLFTCQKEIKIEQPTLLPDKLANIILPLQVEQNSLEQQQESPAEKKNCKEAPRRSGRKSVKKN